MEPLKALWMYMTSSSQYPQPRASMQFLKNRVMNINHRLAAIENLEGAGEPPSLYPYAPNYHRDRRLATRRPLRTSKRIISRHLNRRFL